MTSYAPYLLCAVRVVAGLLFLQHGLEKLFGFAGARPEPTLWGIRGVGGILEAVGGPMLALGLFTRPVAFVLSGEMAVAYFRSWAPRGSFRSPTAAKRRRSTPTSSCGWRRPAPARGVSTGCFSVARILVRSGARVAAWEPQARAILRLILGFLITLHGIRKVFEVLPSVAGRRGAPPLALDSLPPITGYIELVAGPLLMLGLFVRQTALVVSLEALLAYVADRAAAHAVADPERRHRGAAVLCGASLLRCRGRRCVEPGCPEDPRRVPWPRRGRRSPDASRVETMRSMSSKTVRCSR